MPHAGRRSRQPRTPGPPFHWVTGARHALSNRSATAYIDTAADPAHVLSDGRIALYTPNSIIVHQPPGGDESLLLAVLRPMRTQAIAAADTTGRAGDTSAAATFPRPSPGSGEIQQIAKKAATIRNADPVIEELATVIRACVGTAVSRAMHHLHAQPGWIPPQAERKHDEGGRSAGRVATAREIELFVLLKGAPRRDQRPQRDDVRRRHPARRRTQRARLKASLSIPLQTSASAGHRTATRCH